MKEAKATLDDMIRLYTSGMEPEEIKDLLGYKSPDYIINKLRKAKVYDCNRKKVDVGKINALHRAGWSIAKIADEEGLPESKIEEVLNMTQAPIYR